MSWNNQYAAAARHFFYSEAGREFIKELADRGPKINSDNLEKAALSAHRSLGYQDAASVMEKLINFEEKQTPSGPNFVR